MSSTRPAQERQCGPVLGAIRHGGRGLANWLRGPVDPAFLSRPKAEPAPECSRSMDASQSVIASSCTCQSGAL